MKKIKKIKNNFFSRQLGMAKLVLKTGKDFYKANDSPLKERLAKGLGPNISQITEELSEMKGSLMKAGQFLSTMAGAFLPEEAQKVLKSLESQSHFLVWEEIQKQVDDKILKDFEVLETPLAAASLGQVHIGYFKNKKYAIKIQYAGVRKAIKNDVRALRLLLTGLKLIPSEIDLTSVFKEVENMLRQETDYIREKEFTLFFKEKLKTYPEYIIPSVLEEYSNERNLVTEYIDGITLDHLEHIDLTQEQRNRLGQQFMRLLFVEIFQLKVIQTDVHGGNYLLVYQNGEPYWALLDFGATKEAPDSFIISYQALLVALAYQDRDLFFKTMKEMGYISSKKETDEDFFWEYAQVIGEPFYKGMYDWGESQIAEKVFEYIPKVLNKISVGSPPSHSLFIDRKIAGIFFILQKLRSRFDSLVLLEEFKARENH